MQPVRRNACLAGLLAWQGDRSIMERLAVEMDFAHYLLQPAGAYEGQGESSELAVTHSHVCHVVVSFFGVADMCQSMMVIDLMCQDNWCSIQRVL
jgi:hypothetical protein